MKKIKQRKENAVELIFSKFTFLYLYILLIKEINID